MEELIAQLSKDFPDFNFVTGEICCWSPARQEIIYDPDKTDSTSRWTILHELGHALLGHSSYQSDFELLKLEVAAWDRAQELDKTYGQKISLEHIQNCLDTYREWLYRRSLCPTCGNSSLQENPTRYRCFNCHTVWKVTAARFCRPYRRVHLSENEKSPGPKAPATFM
jgi:ribosomal protein S27AE